MAELSLTTSRRRRPPFVTLLGLVVFMLSSVNLASAVITIARRDVFAAEELAIPLEIISISGAIWGLAWLVVGVGLWRCKEWARKGALILFPAYTLVSLVVQVLLARGDYERDQFPFQIVTSCLLVGIIAWGLTRRRTRLAFQQLQDQEEPEHDDSRSTD